MLGIEIHETIFKNAVKGEIILNKERTRQKSAATVQPAGEEDFCFIYHIFKNPAQNNLLSNKAIKINLLEADVSRRRLIFS